MCAIDASREREDNVLLADGDACTGCGICELICSMEKTGEYNPRSSFIRVLRNFELDVNLPALRIGCDFCGKCVEWCPQEALSFVDWREAAMVRKEASLGRLPAPLLE